MITSPKPTPGSDPGFQVRGGGGAHLKKIAPIGGRRENFGGISCEKSRFYANNFFFPLHAETLAPPLPNPYIELVSKSV